MAEGSNETEYPTTTKGMRMGTDPNSKITELLIKWDDFQLFQLTKFYWDRLEQAIEEGVDGVSSLITYEKIFNGKEHRKVTELMDKGNRVDSSKLLLSLVMEKGSRARRVMWESFVKVHHGVPKLDKIIKEIQELGSDPFDYMNIGRGLSEVPSHLKGAQQKHKEILRVQTETLRVNTILIKEKVKIFQLVDRYAELTIISNVRDRTLVEHELLARGRDHEEWRKKDLRRELEKIRTDQLFQSSFSLRKSKSGNSAAVSGVPGIGKTTMVQKIVYDWATGKIYPDFQFVFSFKFRDLNNINSRINLRNLILDQYPYFGNILGELWKSPEGLLFIFDGLDEFKDRIDFADNRRNTEPQFMCTDPECWCEVSDIVYSLIQHKLLPGCSVLVTSRPTALHLLEKAEISVWAEILGFVGDEQKEYFNKFFEDQTVSAAVFKHVEENEILYTMSYNPSYCWILGLSLGPFFTQRDRKHQQVPKTITQLYSYYIYNILKNHGREIESPRDVFLKLGEMAFTGVSEKKIVFRNGDLIQYNLQPSQFLSGFLMELLERDDSIQCVVYTFPHLTIQEFVAAVAQFLSPSPMDIQKLLSEADSEEDGRFEIFLRFVAGLSSPQSARPLEEFLSPFLHQTTCRVIDWVKEKVKGQIGNTDTETGKRNLLNTFHYLFESQNKALAQATVGSVETLAFSRLRLTPIDCVVLSHVLGLCDSIKHLNLQWCNIQCEGLQRLEHVLYKYQKLRLSYNNLGDAGVKLLSVALRNPGCKIQELDLFNNNLTDSCAEDLASVISTNPSLTDLDLGVSQLGDSGVKLLSVALRNSGCKIQRLGLFNNNLTDSCAKDLASVISTNQSLTDLDLGGNPLEDSGVKLLSVALRNSGCKIQRLGLGDNKLTDSCAEDLASVFNRSLTDLNLGYNNLGDSGVKRLSVALRGPDCKIQKLDLQDNNLTDSCTEDLASVISTNQSLTDLNLGVNPLGDSGVKLLSVGLRNLGCKIQRLGLGGNKLTDSCAEDLASVFNRSLTDLNLGNNNLGDSGVKRLSVALRGPDCKIQKLDLLGNKLTDSCAEDLASVFNRSLTDLNLADNKLGDSGVKRLSVALRGPDCKIQKLGLYRNLLTDSCAEDLASALSTNRSLTDLHLGLNHFTDESVPALRQLILNCRTLSLIELRDNRFSPNGENQLKSLWGYRPGLRVKM
ncbi:NACHT, LRR and PYD domains-containing protein 3-like [Cetorhinus maximus]